MDTKHERGEGGLQHISTILPDVLDSIGAPGVLEVTREDARLLHVLASLVEYLPAHKRAMHLAPKCESLARRMERAIKDAA
jgi:hypothetical protein